jgi:hypothetical protein
MKTATLMGRCAARFGSAILVLLIASSGAGAASVEVISGDVLVDHGSGFSAVHGRTQLAPGDTVIANPGGSAKVVYGAGCSVPVEPGSVVSVTQTPPCSIETGAIDPPAEQPGFFNNTTLLIGGGVVVAGGVVAAVVLSQNNHNSPASP